MPRKRDAKSVPKNRPRQVITKQDKQDVQIAELYASSVPIPVISDITGRTNASIQDVLHKFNKLLKIKEDHTTIQNFIQHQGQVLDSAKLQVLKSLLEPGKLALASSKDGAYIYDKLNNASRLAQGQATNNTSIIHNYNLTPKKDE